MTALLVHSVLTQAVTFALRPASAYQALDLQVPAAMLGAVGAAFAVVPLLLAVPVGTLVDGIGERRLMVIGSLVTAAATLTFLAASGSLVGLLVANAVLGAGHLCCVIGQQALVANTAAAHRLDTSFGYYTFAASLGQALGPALIAAVGGSSVRPDTTRVFWLSLALSLAMLASATLLHSARQGQRQPADGSGSGLGALLGTPGLARALTTSAVVLAAVDLTLVYLPALGADRGLASATVGALLTVRAVSSMASRLLLGRLSALLGRTRLMGTSIVLSAGALAACAVPMPPWLLVVVVAGLGLGLGVGQPLTMSWLTEQAPPGQRGRALSLRLAGNRIGQVVIPSAVGAVAVSVGAAGVLATTAAALASTTLLLRGFRLED